VEPVLDRRRLPARFESVEDLEDFMSTPTQALVDDLADVGGDISVLGAAGKMGVTLCRLLKRAAPGRRVVAVSRFGDRAAKERLESWGVDTIPCDLLDADQVEALPRTPNVLYLAGRKFDSTGSEDVLWAMNTVVPANVARVFRESRIVALSTIHVYPWSDPVRGGSTERDGHGGLAGEYAYSVVGRERTFEHYSKKYGTAGRIVRFVYAVDPRYGVLPEIASWVLAGRAVPLATGTVNIMWQGDGINAFGRLLAHCTTPTEPLNVGAPEAVSVRKLATTFGEVFGIEPIFEGEESDCLVVDTDRAARLLGNPVVDTRTMCEWVAHWVKSGLPSLGKPSKFEVRTGKF
jgi:nucleoside-diphosphate-sugar epimerase